MKKVIFGILIGAIGMLGVTTLADEITNLVATKATFEVYVSGEKFESDKPVAVINGSTYLPLKDTGEALGVDVEWNEKNRRVEIGEMKEEAATNPEPIPTEISTPTAAPTIVPDKTITSSTTEKFGDNEKWLCLVSEIWTPDTPTAKNPFIEYQGQQYIALGRYPNSLVDGNYYIQLPNKEPILVQSEITQKYQGRTFVKLSAVGLKARIEGNTAYLEWAE